MRHFLYSLIRASFIALGFFLVSLSWGMEPYQLESVDLAANSVSTELQNKLDPKGLRLVTEVDGLRMEVCELFWARESTGQSHPSTSDHHYADLETGSLIGVIRFLSETSEDFREDFHDQKLKPGFYTMRYARLTDNDERDAILLSPASTDRDGEKTVPLEELSRRSRLASGSHRPATLNLVPTESGKTEYPGLRASDDGTCIVQVMVHLKVDSTPAREVPLAMIVVTPGKEGGGS